MYLLLYVNNYLLAFKKICLIFQTVMDLQRCAQHSSYADVKPKFTLHVTEQLNYVRLNLNFQSLIMTLTTVLLI